MGPRDQELLSRIARGKDEAAFSELYDLHAGLLLGLACRILGDEAEAQDALQEVFLQAWKNAAAYDPGKAEVRTWLAVMTRSRCLDRLRRRKTAGRGVTGPLDLGEGLESPLPSREPAALQAFEDAELRARVSEVLAALPEPQRKVLEDAYFEGLSQSEIAAKNGEPLGTVKTRMRLGTMKLVEGLRPYLEGEHEPRRA